jgi:hypothetical protein
MGIEGLKSLLGQIIHCKNYQQITQKPHHSDHLVFMNSPAQTAMYIHRTFKKQGNNHSCQCYCDFDQYMVHMNMVDIRPQYIQHYHLSICPKMVPRLTFHGKDNVVKCL